MWPEAVALSPYVEAYRLLPRAFPSRGQLPYSAVAESVFAQAERVHRGTPCERLGERARARGPHVVPAQLQLLQPLARGQNFRQLLGVQVAPAKTGEIELVSTSQSPRERLAVLVRHRGEVRRHMELLRLENLCKTFGGQRRRPRSLALLLHLAPVRPTWLEQADVDHRLRPGHESRHRALECGPTPRRMRRCAWWHLGHKPNIRQLVGEPQVGVLLAALKGVRLGPRPRELRHRAPVQEDRNGGGASLAPVPRQVPEQRGEPPEMEALRVGRPGAEPRVRDGQDLGRRPPVV
mmetsp:Transcript_58491/g.178371  ORF Transcript_58491/g.178371 Transcript_58491/m.178371 type:complete len:293 (+) Transcript_58491:103-981(+)